MCVCGLSPPFRGIKSLVMPPAETRGYSVFLIHIPLTRELLAVMRCLIASGCSESPARARVPFALSQLGAAESTSRHREDWGFRGGRPEEAD